MIGIKLKVVCLNELLRLVMKIDSLIDSTSGSKVIFLHCILLVVHTLYK